jgi:ParB-like chromosome segregation protein Spo0J
LAHQKPRPYGRNARKLSEHAVQKIATSIQQFGWRQPIVVDTKGVIICGHTRLLATKLGCSEVPVYIADDLTPEHVKA